MNSKHKQAGWTFQGLMVFFLIAGTVGSVVAKLAPAYADYHTLKQILTSIQGDGELLKKTPMQIRQGLNKKLGINNLQLPSKESVKIVKDKGVVTLAVDYEVRVPLYFNVDAVVYFKENFEATAP